MSAAVLRQPAFEPEIAGAPAVNDGPAPIDSERLERAMNIIGARVSSLSVSIADTAGAIADVAGELTGQAGEFHVLSGDIRRMADSNHQVADAANSAASSAETTRAGLSATSTSIQQSLSLAVDDIKAMAASASEMTEILTQIRASIIEAQGFSDEIRGIATQTQMLAINAGIMAAHAGDAGRGFAVIAESVKQLADKTGTVTKNIVQRLDALSATVGTLQAQNTRNADIAGVAHGRSVEIEGEMTKFVEFGASVNSMIADIGAITRPVANNIQICDTVLERMSALDEQVQQSSGRLAGASRQIDGLVSFGEDLIGYVADSGVETEDTPLIRRCIAAAQAVGALFTAEITAGRISAHELFDERYRPVAGSDPQQVTTAFTALTDRLLPAIQEPMLDVDSRVVFCAALDRNGYLPTHNHKYSQPQGADPVWNAANCRNRRIFNDRTGLAAGRNTKAFLLQTYRRDMGGGSFTLMKDLSAPIHVGGRHWGGLRIGYKV
jgi:methyl-accepting chemotaxis protein